MVRLSPFLLPALLFGANYLPASGFVGFIAAVAVHETGHILAAALCGKRIYRVALSPLGAEIYCSSSSYLDDLVCAAAGPAASIIFSALLAAVEGAFSAPAAISLLLGLLNILPVQGLDGGNMISAFLSLKSGLPPPHAAESVLGAAALFLLFFMSCFVFLRTGDNPTMLLLCLFMMMKTDR